MAACLQTHIHKTRYSFAEWMAGTPAWNLPRRLRSLTRPLSVLFGGADEVFDAEKSAAVFRRVSDVQCETIAGASHSGILFHPQAYAAIQRRIE